MRCLKGECIIHLDHIPVVDESRRIVFVQLAKERPQDRCTGAVIASGIPDVSVGDRVMYRQGHGTPARQGNAQYLVLDAASLLATIEKDFPE